MAKIQYSNIISISHSYHSLSYVIKRWARLAFPFFNLKICSKQYEKTFETTVHGTSPETSARHVSTLSAMRPQLHHILLLEGAALKQTNAFIRPKKTRFFWHHLCPSQVIPRFPSITESLAISCLHPTYPSFLISYLVGSSHRKHCLHGYLYELCLTLPVHFHCSSAGLRIPWL